MYLHTERGPLHVRRRNRACSTRWKANAPTLAPSRLFRRSAGLWGKPTIVQNVETLCNVPCILANGPEWFKKLSYTADGGTKLYGASGKVKRPGLWELPMGTTVREILEEHAGGMRDGVTFRGLLPGGASTDFLVEEHLDVRMDFTEVQKAGSRLGTGTMIVLDDKTCPVGMVREPRLTFSRRNRAVGARLAGAGFPGRRTCWRRLKRDRAGPIPRVSVA